MGILNGNGIYNNGGGVKIAGNINTSTSEHTSYSDIRQNFLKGYSVVKVQFDEDEFSYGNLTFDGANFFAIVPRNNWSYNCFYEIKISSSDVLNVEYYFINRPQPGDNGKFLTIGSNYNVLEWKSIDVPDYIVTTGSFYLNKNLYEVPNGRFYENFTTVAGYNSVEIKITVDSNNIPIFGCKITCTNNLSLNVTANYFYLEKRTVDNWNLEAGKKYYIKVIGLLATIEEIV